MSANITTNLRRQDFNFDLPTKLIAQHPTKERSASRLLYLDADENICDLNFSDFPTLLTANDLLLFNDTRVIKARLLGHKNTGGQVELLVERILNKTHALAHIRASNPPKAKQQLFFAQKKHTATVLKKQANGLYELAFDANIASILEEYGQLPLPPYITHTPTEIDEHRYQTVYAKKNGAIAAPTAGLHFDKTVLQALKAKHIQQLFVTLHVGAGTFQPVRTESIQDHIMHSEQFTVPAATIKAIQQTKARGGRVIAVGTTSLRALESAACFLNGQNEFVTAEKLSDGSIQGDSQLFITPGYQFQWVNALLTNFHLPQSTLLMLVSAMAGMKPIQKAYTHAIKNKYRFFSYGDAMFIDIHSKTF